MENVINDGSTTLEDQLGAVADLQLAIRSRKLQDDIMVVRLSQWPITDGFVSLVKNVAIELKVERVLCKQIAGDMLCADQNFDIAQVIRFFKSKVWWHMSNMLD